jgi:hypothetical protein
MQIIRVLFFLNPGCYNNYENLVVQIHSYKIAYTVNIFKR